MTIMTNVSLAKYFPEIQLVLNIASQKNNVVALFGDQNMISNNYRTISIFEPSMRGCPLFEESSIRGPIVHMHCKLHTRKGRAKGRGGFS